MARRAVASRPFLVDKANAFLKGKQLTDEVIDEAAKLVASRAKPMDNADFELDLLAAEDGHFARHLRFTRAARRRRPSGAPAAARSIL